MVWVRGFDSCHELWRAWRKLSDCGTVARRRREELLCVSGAAPCFQCGGGRVGCRVSMCVSTVRSRRAFAGSVFMRGRQASTCRPVRLVWKGGGGVVRARCFRRQAVVYTNKAVNKRTCLSTCLSTPVALWPGPGAVAFSRALIFSIIFFSRDEIHKGAMHRLLLMAAIISAVQGFVPAARLLPAARHALRVPQRAYGATCGRMLQMPLRGLAMGVGAGETAASFEEYATKRSTFEPNEPRVGPTAAQSSGATSTWPNYYCAPDLDRTGRDELLQPGAESAALSAAGSRFVLVWQGKNLFNTLANGEYTARFLSPMEAEPLIADPNAIVIFLGVRLAAFKRALG